MNSNSSDYSGIYIDDGLGAASKDRYQKRRRAIASSINYPTIIFGVDEGPGGENPWVHLPTFVYQEPLMLYLTGINQVKVALFLDPTEPEKDILFLPKKDPKRTFWDGMHLGVGTDASNEEARAITGFSNVKDINHLHNHLKEVLSASKDAKKLGMFWHESKERKRTLEDSNFFFKQVVSDFLEEKKLKDVEIINIASVQWRLRLQLDAVDQENAKTANQITATAFKTVLKELTTCNSETDVAGRLNGAINQGSYFLNSFPSIVAAGKNATILHYMKNNAPFKSGDMILLDFGARWQNMCADVSRTVPVNGRFSPLQKLLYGIVLEAQKAVESAAKPGTTIAHLNQVCWDYINQELQEKIIAKGGKVRLDYKVRPHNVSHLMGVQVHEGDPFRHYRNHKLKADWMISNEPGLYGHFSLTIDGELHEQTIGIRIEDNLIITKDGCRNLSLGCPKEIKALEQLIQPSTRT